MNYLLAMGQTSHSLLMKLPKRSLVFKLTLFKEAKLATPHSILEHLHLKVLREAKKEHNKRIRKSHAVVETLNA